MQPRRQQAWQFALALPVLLGLSMPYVSGEQVLETVAADPTLAARHRIIMVTGSIE